MDNCKFINTVHDRLGHSGNAPFLLLVMQTSNYVLPLKLAPEQKSFHIHGIWIVMVDSKNIYCYIRKLCIRSILWTFNCFPHWGGDPLPLITIFIHHLVLNWFGNEKKLLSIDMLSEAICLWWRLRWSYESPLCFTDFHLL